MANTNPSKNSKWFPNKALLKLSLSRLRRPKKMVSATERSRDCFREVFHRFDSDGDGRISVEELRSFLAWAGNCLSVDEAAAIARDLGAGGGGGLIDYEKFARLVGCSGGGEHEDDLRRAFEMFEEEEGAGCITPSGLRRVLGGLGEKRTEEECAAMIRVYDLDGNGVLDYHEFHRMMS